MPLTTVWKRPAALKLGLAFGALWLSLSVGTDGMSPCRASLLSVSEAEALLNNMPQAIYIRRRGGYISPFEWSPGSGYREDLFYFFMVLSPKRQLTFMENGIVGYFAVNKTTGDVFEFVVPGPRLKGTELRRLQQKLRQRHCVSPDVVRKNRETPFYAGPE